MIDNTELRKILGENVRRLRLDKGWSQRVLGEKVGVKLLHVHMIETGKTSLSAEVLFSLADALNVPTDSLRQLSPVHS